MRPRETFLLHLWARVVRGQPMRLIRGPALLLGQCGLVFVCMYLVPFLCFCAGERTGVLIAGGYEFDTWVNSWAAWYTWLGTILFGPLAVAFLTIVMGGRGWLAAVSLALLPYTAIQIQSARDSPFFYGTPVPPGVDLGLFWSSLWWAVPIASSLLAIVGAGLGMAYRRRRDTRTRLVSSGPAPPACFIRGLAAVLGRSGLVLVCMYITPHLLIRMEGLAEEVILAGYSLDPRFSAWSGVFTELGSILIGSLGVAFVTIVAGGRRWLAAVAVALLLHIAVQFRVAYDSSSFTTSDAGSAVGFSLLAMAGAALGMVVRRRRDKSAQLG